MTWSGICPWLTTQPTRPDPARAAQPTTRLDSAQVRAASLIGGRYELGELIGEGGAAQVYHARDKVLDRVVALKLLRDEYGADEEFIARFYREARAVASLSQPNIVDIYDYGAHEKTYFIAMQYIEGTDLKSILRSEGRLDPARVVAISDDILRGLGAAHERGIVHRDVKPQNLLVRASDGHVKLTDFGVARTLDASRIPPPVQRSAPRTTWPRSRRAAASSARRPISTLSALSSSRR